MRRIYIFVYLFSAYLLFILLIIYNALFLINIILINIYFLISSVYLSLILLVLIYLGIVGGLVGGLVGWLAEIINSLFPDATRLRAAHVCKLLPIQQLPDCRHLMYPVMYRVFLERGGGMRGLSPFTMSSSENHEPLILMALKATGTIDHFLSFFSFSAKV